MIHKTISNSYIKSHILYIFLPFHTSRILHFDSSTLKKKIAIKIHSTVSIAAIQTKQSLSEGRDSKYLIRQKCSQDKCLPSLVEPQGVTTIVENVQPHKLKTFADLLQHTATSIKLPSCNEFCTLGS